MIVVPSFAEFKAANGTGFTDEDFALPSSLEDRKLDLIDKIRPGHMKKMANMISFIGRGFCTQQLAIWLDYFQIDRDLKMVQYEAFQKDEPRYFRDILDFIEVDKDGWTLDDEEFKKELSPVKKREEIHLGSMDPILRSYLQMMYKPFNDELADLLGEEWRGVWD